MITLSATVLQELLYKAMCIGADDMKQHKPDNWVESSTFFRDLTAKSTSMANDVVDGRYTHNIDLERVAAVI